MTSTHEDNVIFDRAITWLSDLRDGITGPNELFQWLSESPRHVEEIMVAMSLMDEIAGLTVEECAAIRSMGAQAPSEPTDSIVVRWPVRAAAELGNHPSSRAEPGSRDVRLWAAAALLIVVLVSTLWFIRNDGRHHYVTALGEQRTIELEDGSIMHLNTQSRVEVRLDTRAREIRLIRGEVLFRVHRDPQRPFRVIAAGSIIEALATEFNVYRRDDGIRVTVIEGAVGISPESGRGQPALIDRSVAWHAQTESRAETVAKLNPGEEARIPDHGQFVVHRVDAAQATAWRQRRLVFHDNSLAEIAEQFNRYNREPKILIADTGAGSLRFAATFDADAPESLINVLSSNPTLVVQRSDQSIVVRSRDSHPADGRH